MIEKSLFQVAINSPFREILTGAEELDRDIYNLAKKTILNRAFLNYQRHDNATTEEIISSAWNLINLYEFKYNFKNSQKFPQE